MSAAATFSWQANLLDPALTARSARKIAALMIPGVVVGMVIAGVIGYTQSSRAGLNDLRSRAETAERRVKDGERRLAANGGQDLEARRQSAEAIEAELVARRALLGSLRSSLASDDSSWQASAVLATLSERHRDGLWLTRISIDRMRREVGIEGRVVDAQLLSAYVAGLGQRDSALAKLPIRQVEGDRDESPSNDAAKAAVRYLKFKLLSQGARP